MLSLLTGTVVKSYLCDWEGCVTEVVKRNGVEICSYELKDLINHLIDKLLIMNKIKFRGF